MRPGSPQEQPPQRRLQTPSSIFGPRRGYVCGSAPPEIESQLRAWSGAQKSFSWV